VHEEMDRQNLGPENLGNAAGSIFRRGFYFTGEFRNSERVSNHRRTIRVWRLK
jgi:hypothetical protein